MILRVIACVYIFSFAVTLSAVEYDGGFCHLNKLNQRRFPLNPPERHIPWVWDAVISSVNRYVEVTMISRNACKFDQRVWKSIITKFPQYSDQLGNGTVDNIYVPVDYDFDYVRRNKKLSGELARGIQDHYVYCTYEYRGETVARVRSRKINDVEIAELSTIQIRCPLPDSGIKWEQMRIERILSSLPEERVLNNSTEPFTACPDQCPGDDSANYKYKLSVCTATSRSYRPHLVEWIEYHRLMGVEHFFIYDTNSWDVSESSLLSSTLQDYIRANVVTVFRWPYENCVRNMGSGRWVNILTPRDNDKRGNRTEMQNIFFQPPRAISQTAALASCYSRHRCTSQWMAHMDDDEFLAFNPSQKFDSHKARSISHLADLLSTKDPNVNAIYFLPLCVDDCSRAAVTRDPSFLVGSSILPRYRKWNKARFCPVWEGKLVMRTAAIGMFFTHYITLREQGNWNRKPYELSREEAAVIHFKVSNEVSGSVYGARLPIKRSHYPIEECKAPATLKSGLNASRLLDRFTSLLSSHLERRYISQISEQ